MFIKRIDTAVRIFLLVAAFFSPIFSASQALADDAAIDNVAFDKGPPSRVSFEVTNAFTKEIDEAIKSGVPTSFTYIIELNRVNKVWFNEGVGKREFRHTVKYDTLKEEYEVSREEAGPDSMVRTKDPAEMKRIMSTGESVTLDFGGGLLTGAEYEVRIMAELHTVELPFLLDYVFFFVKLWDFETEWYTFKFTF